MGRADGVEFPLCVYILECFFCSSLDVLLFEIPSTGVLLRSNLHVETRNEKQKPVQRASLHTSDDNKAWANQFGGFDGCGDLVSGAACLSLGIRYFLLALIGLPRLRFWPLSVYCGMVW